MKFTIRVRLTALFAALFVVLAAVLVATSYAFVARNTGPEARGVERAATLQEALTDLGVDFPAREFPERPANGPRPQNDPLADALHDIELQTRAQVLRDLLTTSLVAFAISAVFAVGLAYWLAGRVLRPIDEVTKAANSLSESTLDRRLDNEGPEDEFGRLKTSLNAMLDRLERAFESRQRFASDASHELRTPLAVMQASADNALAAPRAPRQARELAEEVLRQVARSDSLMSSLLALSRADDVIHTREPVDLADIVATVVSDLEPMATDAGVRLELEVEDAPVRGDRVLLERLAVNLVDNAIRYNVESDGWVSCRVWSDGDQSIVEMANSGEPLPPSEVGVLFERFRRGAQRSEVAGHGLGLPIVSRVAEVHGGTVEAVPRESGGLIVTVRLPRMTEARPDPSSAT